MLIYRLVIALLLGFFTALAYAESASVEQFTPRGTAKNVRQATVRFATSMVPFGEPRLPDAFSVICPVKGTGRWIDDRTWVYDFARDVPAGLRCSFKSKSDLADLAGQSVPAATYSFSTGGPAVIESIPYQGSEAIDEEQIFILGLDAPATARSVLDHAWCDVAGLAERVPVRLVTGADRATLMDAQRGFVERHLRRYFRPGGKPYRKIDWQRARDSADAPIAMVQCQRRLPNDAKLRLIWGAGIAAATGVTNAKDQVLAFKTRPAFRARLTCQRVNRTAPCIPVLPMTLSFSAPVPRTEAEKIALRGEDGKTYPAAMAEGTAFVSRLTFRGPFPERATFKLELPAGLKDDAGRTLANTASFPLTVKTDENPPLAKFAARFGIVEADAGALLPVTVRDIAGKTAASGTPAIDGRMLRANTNSVADLIGWMRKLKALEGSEWRYDEKTRKNVLVRRAGERSIFAQGQTTAPFRVPRSTPAKSMEVIGIPLKRPGFYVVELASPRLGAALLGKTQSYYVQAAALVTNLAVHLKLGRESSLVWVTSLDRGEPVSGAEVTVADCGGRAHFTGTTDTQGLVRIGQALPDIDTLPGCLDNYDKAYVVTARMRDDVGFVLSTWNEGIAPWRFNLPEGSWHGPIAATTVFDRTLLRAGETVHMKHFVRRHTERGFELVATSALASHIIIRHDGSEDRYELPVAWDAQGIAESSWVIPKEAKQGVYTVSMVDRLAASRGGPPEQERSIGSFRVEAFRVPTMKAVLVPPKMPLVNADTATFDVQVSYLSGGGAGLLPARMRGLIEPKSVRFPGYDGFVFANGDVKEGVRESGAEAWEPGELDEEGAEIGADAAQAPGDARRIVTGESLTLDAAGGGRFTLKNLPRFDTPQSLIAELEYPDPNGERLTASTRVPLWPAHVLVGLKLDNWVAARDRLKFQTIVVDTSGHPVAGRKVQVDLLQSKFFSHRKRLIGGFYAYDSVTEVKRIGPACEGETDQLGLLACEVQPPVSGNVVLRARVEDESGNVSYANRDAWVAGKDDWWFDQKDADRMDLLPERKRYEPGERARFQVRMPFRQAQALVTVEREGVIEGFVTRLDGRAPVVDVPVTGNYAPNVFVSALAVRGRVADVQPTSMVDLGKPAFRLGIAEIAVGYRAHELAVAVKPEREVYRVREKAQITISVARADGGKLPEGGEIALAAVDEGLLELLPNESWKLLEAMMQRRGIEVDTATAQMHVIGKRHFGRKALPAGGGGGRLNARELFETLLLWRARVKLDTNGQAQVEVPLNDSLTSFRIVAVAAANAGLFGTGEARIRTTQDLMLISGLAPVVRDGDQVVNLYTVRNASEKSLAVEVTPSVQALDSAGRMLPSPRLGSERVALAPGAAKEMTSEFIVPAGTASLAWEISAQDAKVAGAKDALKLTQRVVPAVEVATLQATIAQIEDSLTLPVQVPAGALPGRGSVRVTLSPRLAADLPGVRDYMTAYPYTCFEQRASQAIALRDRERWARVLEALPAHLDGDGLVKYFPTQGEGSDVLTAYLLAVSHEAGWQIPDDLRARMVGGLSGFVQGRVIRGNAVGAADLVLRKIAALEALSRFEAKLSPRLLDAINVEPNLWPTSALIDWISLLGRMESAPDRQQSLTDARGILRARMSLQGTVLGFSTERQDRLWWLMASPNTNANRALLLLMDEARERGDIARLARGALMRQSRGHWDTTVANAWGVLAFDRFAQRFESESVTGVTRGAVGGEEKSLEWSARPQGGDLDFAWPRGMSDLSLTQVGSGKPWATIASRAAVPLAAPVASGMRVTRTVAPIEQKTAGAWTRGDIARVRLEMESDLDMSWLVVSDPIPAGAMILGGGLGGDSRIATAGERTGGYIRPAFEERRFETYRAYYAFVPKGRWSVDYTVRLNNAGRFEMPPTRIEALYAPEVFGAVPNAAVEVRP